MGEMCAFGDNCWQVDCLNHPYPDRHQQEHALQDFVRERFLGVLRQRADTRTFTVTYLQLFEPETLYRDTPLMESLQKLEEQCRLKDAEIDRVNSLLHIYKTRMDRLGKYYGSIAFCFRVVFGLLAGMMLGWLALLLFGE